MSHLMSGVVEKSTTYPVDTQTVWVVYLLNSEFKGEKKFWDYFQPAAFTCWKLTVETLKQGVKYVES